MIQPVSTSSFQPGAPAPNARRPLDTTQVQQALARGRQAAALFSTLLPAAPGGAQFFSAPARGAGAYSPAGTRERLNLPLLKEMQAGRVTSNLLDVFHGQVSPLFAPQQRGAAILAARVAPGAARLQPGLAATRETVQAPGPAQPGPLSPRMASEAYRAEAQAPRGAGGWPAGRWEWFA
jgi:hypothetical protein